MNTSVLTSVFTAFAPVFLLIGAGWVLRASNYMPATFWSGINALNYRVLLPAVLFTTLARLDVSTSGLAATALAAGLASLVMIALGLGAARLLRLAHGAAAPLIGAAALWNVVLVMALSERLFGAASAASTAAAVGAGIIVGTLCMVTVFAIRRPSGAARRIVTDPVVLAALAGLALAFAGLEVPQAVMSGFEMAGAGALAVILLSMGAGLDFKALSGRVAPLSLAAVLRCLISPLVFAGLGLALHVESAQLAVLILAGAAPGAAYLYAMTAEFDGEAGLAAGMITLTVIVAALVMPIVAIIGLSL
ncbi:MAG: AEC family transporter [Pseudomonadota bacterium]